MNFGLRESEVECGMTWHDVGRDAAQKAQENRAPPRRLPEAARGRGNSAEVVLAEIGFVLVTMLGIAMMISATAVLFPSG
jgi:hypothetical protein